MSSPSAQIIEKLSRAGRGGIRNFELTQLRGSWEEAKKKALHGFADFIPIRLVTILENAFRETVKALIDSDPDCKRNALNYVAKLQSKSIAEAIFYLDQERFTIGDVVCTTVSCGKLDDIVSCMEALYGSSFKRDLSESRERWLEDEGNFKDSFIKDIEVTFSLLQRLFQVRHILVHELPTASPYKQDEISLFFEQVQNFVEAMSWLVTFKLCGVIPKTQTKMNAVSGQKAAETKDILAAKYGQPLQIPEGFPAFDEHTAWSWFVHQAALAISGLGKPRSGTMASMLYSAEVRRLNEWRLKDLESRSAHR